AIFKPSKAGAKPGKNICSLFKTILVLALITPSAPKPNERQGQANAAVFKKERLARRGYGR
ncbi:MAG: hypothetical protein LBR56_08515, partial [Sporomusaceae bacterium]|nr:hypothetical protein [Sporomusaceae bacterium]